jgi:type VI secretion system protein ImpK
LTGENEHEQERDNAGDSMTPDEAMPETGMAADESPIVPEAEADVPRQSRRFRAWGAAQQASTPSVWSRASASIKKLFTKPKPAVTDADMAESELDLAADAPAFEAEGEVIEASSSSTYQEEAPEFTPVSTPDDLSFPVVEAPVETVAEIALPEIPDEPKEDLKFLRTGEADAITESDAMQALYEGPTGEMPPTVPEEPAPEPPRKKRASLLKRVFFTPIVFGRPKKPAADEAVPDTGEHPVPADIGDGLVEPVGEAQSESFESSALDGEPSLDEALPMDSSMADDESITQEPVAETRKVGFFGRLFGRKRAEVSSPVEEDVEQEFEAEPVVDLDAADEGFEAARSEFAPPENDADQSFATVDDALPLDAPSYEATMDAQPAVSKSSFVPPEPAVTEPFSIPAVTEPFTPPPVTPAPVAASDEHSFFGGNTFDFETPKSDERSTLELSPVADERKTAEVTPDIVAHADEVERKTDEFEMVELDGATLQEPAVSPLEGKTAEVPKVSIFKKLFSRTKEVTQVEPAVAPPPSANPTFLVQKFRTFYNEVVVYKNQKADLTAGFATAIVTSYDADLSPEQAANSLSQRLQQMLELQLAESSWMGGEIQELYPNAQYAMACLADEMLSNMEWPGQAAWGKHRLELTVFKTAASDLELFKRVDKLLKGGPQTVGTRDLARTYLLAIASGFKGKYRPFDLPRALAEYRRRLYEFVYGGDALLLYAEERRIFPEATSVTIESKGVKRFSLAQQWAAILVLILVGYTVISHMAWKKVSADLKDIAGRVEQARNPSPPEAPNGGGGR